MKWCLSDWQDPAVIGEWPKEPGKCLTHNSAVKYAFDMASHDLLAKRARLHFLEVLERLSVSSAT